MGHNKDRQQGFSGVRPSEYGAQKEGFLTRGTLITILIIVLIIAGIGYAVWENNHRDGVIDGGVNADVQLKDDTVTDDTETPTTTNTPAVTPSANNTVQIAVLADPELFDFGNEKIRGCDAVVMVPKQIAPTPRVLHAALTTLFTDTFNHGFTPGNFIPTQKDLKFEKVTIVSGVANVFLTGKVGPIRVPA